MKKMTRFKKRALSLVLCLALFLSLLPVMPFLSSADVTDRVADASTMDDWKNFFGPDVPDTENAGGVWGDKSVFTDADAFGAYGIQMDDEDRNFLVALSAIASNKFIIGYSAIPTDTVLVLDLSNSMSADSLAEMVEATNAAIRELQTLNRNNRVSVVVYSGTSGWNSYSLENSASVLLPLDRYTGVLSGGTENFLSYSSSRDRVSVITGVKGENNSWNRNYPSQSASGATYIQAGLQLALDQFNSVSDVIVPEGPQKGVRRMPTLVLMSDGAPTVATTSYTNVGNSTHGNGGSISTVNSFLTQLSAVWVRTQMEKKYGRSALFYTLGLDIENNDTAVAVLNPTVTTPTLSDYWNGFLSATGNYSSRDFTVSVNDDVKSFFRTESGSYEFRDYVSGYYQASSSGSTGNQLINAFDRIVDQIIIQSKYYPTFVESGNYNLDGYLTFTDELGEYMEVKDIKGLTVAGKLYQGSVLAQAVANGEFGNITSGDSAQLTAAGREMLKAIIVRIGCTESEAFSLVANAVRASQLSYSAEGYSNYIGWYADEDGKFLGFWDGGEVDASVGASYVNKSYGFMGTVGSSEEYNLTDMLYVSVQVHKNIESGHEQVLYRIPASLVPMVEYEISFDGTDLDTGSNFEMQITGATEPLRLIFEVGLRSDINAINVNDKIAKTYKFKNSNGYTFYTNSWGEHVHTEDSSVDSHDATYMDFRPSLENERYYYTSNTPIYDESGAQVTYDPKTREGKYYFRTTYFSGSSAALGSAQKKDVFVEISAQSIALSVYDETFGEWVVPKGTPYRRIFNSDGQAYAIEKINPATDTLDFSNYPSLVHPSENDPYRVDACLGNNGQFTLVPAQGIALTKTMEFVGMGENELFNFEITLSGADLPEEYPVYNYEGALLTTAKLASGNKLSVSLKPGETVYVAGIPTDTEYSVVEVLPVGSPWKVKASTGTEGKIALYEFREVSFQNTPTTYGNLLINKTVRHPFGNDYPMPDKVFDVTVTLGGVADGTTVTVDGSNVTVTGGKLDLQLVHGQTVVIENLPADATYTVTEKAYPGFTASGTGLTGVISDSTNAEALLVNTYSPASAELNLSHVGVKHLDGRPWQEGDSFTFTLQYFNGIRWENVSSETRTVTKDTAGYSFSFDALLKAYDFNRIGDYSFRILESYVELGGVVCDTAEKNFTVTVEDDAFSGALKITKVTTQTPNNFNSKSGTVISHDTSNDTWTVTTHFNNVYSVRGTASVQVNVTKEIVNHTGVPFGKNGFTFEIYEVRGTHEFFLGTTVPTDLNGKTVYTFSIDANRLGETMTFKVVEVNGGTEGVIYDTSAKTFTVTLKDNLDGSVSALVNGADTNVFETSFTNTYNLTPADLTVTGKKNLTGRDLLDGEFVFELYRCADGQFSSPVLVASAQNAGDLFTLKDSLSVAGTYYYLVKERATHLPHVTSDTAEYRLTVTVSKGAGATLKAEISSVTKTGSSQPDAEILFNNVYAPDPTHLAIFGAKTMTGRTPRAGEFRFLLLENGSEIGRVTNNENGNFVFDEIEFTVAGTYVYTVKEDLSDKKDYIVYDESVFTVTVTVTDDGAGNLSKTVSYEKGGQAVSGIVFHNEYRPSAIGVTLEGTKVMTGRDPLDKEFTFLLSDIDGTALGSAQNAADGSFAFSPLSFTKAGTYVYVISEVVDASKDYIHYDAYRTFVIVTVTDDGAGNLAASVAYQKGTSYVNGILFQNAYNPDPVFVSLRGSKTMTVRNPKAGEFSFLLIDAATGETLQTVTNNAGGTFLFRDLEFDEKGVYTYVVKESLSDRKGYVVYDESVYTVTVTVTDDNYGTLSYAVTYEKDGNPAQSMAFANEYKPAAATLTLSGTKTMTVRDPKSGEFSFLLVDSEGQTVATVKNGADGTFSFPTLTFSAAGTYTYTVKEDLTGKKEYVVYDESVYTVTVTVTDDTEGVLSATASYRHNGASSAGIVFRNVYNPAETTAVISGTKHLEGRQLKAEEFLFVLTDSQGRVIESRKNDGQGNFSFSALTYSAAGTYVYTVTEDVSSKQDSVDYDANVYTVTVTVSDDGEGTLTASVAYRKGNETANGISFTNTYNPDSIFVTLKGQKDLTFRSPKANEFSFILSDSTGTEIETVKNGADGSFVFRGIELKAKGVYTYTVKEDLSDRKGYIVYDESVYTVTVTVTDDDNDGVLSYDVAYAKGTASAQEIRFANEYKPTAATVTLEGLKSMKYRDPKDGEFTFLLLDSEGKTVSTGKNGSDGKFSFASLVFSNVGTYTYTVKEDLSDKKDYIVYDETPVTVTVTVTDDTVGTLSAQVTYQKNGSVNGIAFENTYDPADAFAVLKGHKTLEGRKLYADEFVFVLADRNGNVLDTKKNDANGDFSFGTLSFNAAGTYVYTVTEDATDKKDNVAYDTNVYTVTVTVTDKGGALEASVKYEAKDPTNAENASFNNVFTPVPVEVPFAAKKAVKNDTPKQIGLEGFRFTVIGDGLTAPLTAVSDEKGNVSFGSLKYTAADVGKVYNYVISEVKGDMANMTYDETEVKVSVEITVTEDGVLVPVVKQDGKLTESVMASFTNVFVPASVDGAILVKKILTNNTQKQIGLAGFEFLLSGDGLTAPLSVKSDEKGDAAFPVISYAAGDIGKTFNYTVTEVAGTMENMVYDKSEVRVSVSVTVNGEGEIVPVYKVNGQPVETAVATFTNVYHENPNTSDHGLQTWMLLALVGSCMAAAAVVLKKHTAEEQ